MFSVTLGVVCLFFSVFRGFGKTHRRTRRCVAFVLAGGRCRLGSGGCQSVNPRNASSGRRYLGSPCRLIDVGLPLLFRQNGNTGRELASGQGTNTSTLFSGMSARAFLARERPVVDVGIGRMTAEFYTVKVNITQRPENQIYVRATCVAARSP